jgi:hypothetical protein
VGKINLAIVGGIFSITDNECHFYPDCISLGASERPSMLHPCASHMSFSDQKMPRLRFSISMPLRWMEVFLLWEGRWHKESE